MEDEDRMDATGTFESEASSEKQEETSDEEENLEDWLRTKLRTNPIELDLKGEMWLLIATDDTGFGGAKALHRLGWR